MQLDITPELIRELAEYGARTGRPDQTGIVLTQDGWDTDCWTDFPAGPVALTADDLFGWLGGEEMDDDAAQARTTPADQADGPSYRIHDERGSATTPAEDANPVVVTGEWEGEIVTKDEYTAIGGPVEMWQSAFWFDQSGATLLGSTQGKETGSETELWCTAAGRYVAFSRQPSSRGWVESWVALTVTQAAELGYHLPADEYTHTTPLIAAVRLARQLADTLTAPTVPYITGDYGQRLDRADTVVDDAIDVEAAAKAVTEVLRSLVLPHLRQTRAEALRVVVLAEGGSQSAAARRLGISQQTLNSIVGPAN